MDTTRASDHASQVDEQEPDAAFPSDSAEAESALEAGAGLGGESRLGGLLAREGLITESDLQAALRIQQHGDRYRPLGEILVANGVLTQKRLDYVLDRHGKRPRLGQILVREGLISEEQLALTLARQNETGDRLGDLLVRLNLVSERAMRLALCRQLGIAFVDLDSFIIDGSVVGQINRAYATRHGVIPIARLDHCLTVAMEDPTDSDVIEEIQASMGSLINVVTSTRDAFARVWSRFQHEDAEIPPPSSGHRLELLADDGTPAGWKVGYSVGARRADDLVRDLLRLATKVSASDIHLEALEGRLLTRFRIDGILQELSLEALERAIQTHQREIVSRIKILGGLDIAERRRPQDGSFRVRTTDGHNSAVVNVRVSVIPGYHGEGVVLRLLDPRKAPARLAALGFSPRLAERLERLLKRTTGILLLSGPTGSGKSTTLHAALMTVYRPKVKVLTAEDPIEYVYEHFHQAEVNEKIGNTFAYYLRAFLRHDPDVIMIGEIRDLDTAEMAFRAAQTGHLLLSTLHSTNAVSAITRLLDLNVDRNVLTSSLIGIMSQRLVRTICTSCREPCTPSPALLREFYRTPPWGERWYRGRGCTECNFTGYRGRTAVGELWVPSDHDVRLINKGAPFEEIQASALESTVLMAEETEGLLKAGRTTLEELLRTLPYASIRQLRARPTGVACPTSLER